MKSLFFIGLFIIMQSCFAQNQLTVEPKPHSILNSVNHSTMNSANRSAVYNSFMLSYDDYEYNTQMGINGGYMSFIYNTNYNYTAADSSMKYTTVAFDSIVDSENMISYNLSSFTSLRIDSIFASIGYENNSGLNDTLIFKIMNVTGATNFPGTTIYKRDTLILTPADAGTNWLISSRLSHALNYTLPTGIKKFALRMEYHGAKMDTLGIVAGFTNEGPSCGSASYKPIASVFYPNSYRLLTHYAAYGLLPNANGADFYIDCNMNGTMETTDGKSTYQNASLGLWITTDPTPTATNDKIQTTSFISQNQPNPFNKTSTINYSLTSNTDVNINFYDVTGRIVKVINEKNASAGKHALTINSTEFANGVYFYTFNAGGIKQTKRMMIVE